MSPNSAQRSGWGRSIRALSTALLCNAMSSTGSPAAATDQCPNGGNLVKNCGMEAPGGISGDLSFWELIAGDDFDPSSEFFHTGGFSADIDSLDQGAGLAFLGGMETCVEGVVPGEIYLFGTWRHLVGGGAFVSCFVRVRQLGASKKACGGTNLGEFDGQGGPDADWQEIVSKFQANASIQDVLLTVSCSTNLVASDFQLNIDDVYLIPLSTIFLDDFEFAPDSCNWSASVGGSCP